MYPLLFKSKPQEVIPSQMPGADRYKTMLVDGTFSPLHQPAMKYPLRTRSYL